MIGLKKGIYIMCPSGIEVIDTTIEAENRYEQAIYLEKRYARLKARKINKKAKWYRKLAIACGL